MRQFRSNTDYKQMTSERKIAIKMILIVLIIWKNFSSVCDKDTDDSKLF